MDIAIIHGKVPYFRGCIWPVSSRVYPPIEIKSMDELIDPPIAPTRSERSIERRHGCKGVPPRVLGIDSSAC